MYTLTEIHFSCKGTKNGKVIPNTNQKKKKNQNIAKVDFRIRNTNKHKESIFIMDVKGDS